MPRLPCSPPHTAIQIELEREAKEAVGKEKALVERSLQAEQRLAEAMRKVRWEGQVSGGREVDNRLVPGEAGRDSAGSQARMPAPHAATPHHSSIPAGSLAPRPRRRQRRPPRRLRRSGPPSLRPTPRRASCSACWTRCAARGPLPLFNSVSVLCFCEVAEQVRAGRGGPAPALSCLTVS